MKHSLALLCAGAFVCASALQGQLNTFEYDTSEDEFLESAILDLRSLNEGTAGENGWIYREGDTLYMPDGTPVRFWGINAQGTNVEYHARWLAKMGMNMARLHGPKEVVSDSSVTVDDVDQSKVDEIWRRHAAMRDEGIYTTISWYFVLGVNIQARWNIPGYTQEFLNAQDEPGEVKPFGVFFWEPMFRDAYKVWADALFAAENTYTGIALADDPACAIIEIQNEDSLFFWTFDMGRYPEVQRQNLEGMFYDWLVEKYGSVELAQAAWGDYNAGTFSRDNAQDGRFEIKSRFNMSAPDNFSGNELRNRQRMADQVQFLTELQYNFYVEMRDYITDDLGYQGLFVASNWKTDDWWNLEDIERYTYSATDILDRHDYFGPRVYDGPRFPASGSKLYALPLVKIPRSGPAIYKQVENRGSMLSETAWTNLFPHKIESSPIIAATNALQGVDVWFWFASQAPGFAGSWGQWSANTPDTAGQYPAASLIMRRGYLDEAPAVVREGRTLETMYMRNRNIFPDGTGFDVTRDDEFGGAEGVTGSTAVDLMAAFAGKISLAFDTDDDFIHPELNDIVDVEGKSLTSVTGEFGFDWDIGLVTINSPRAQGAVGYLSEERRITLDHARITSENEFGSVLIVSLDDRPLTQADQVFIQVGAQARLTGENFVPWTTSWGGGTVEGFEAIDIGTQPWLMDNIGGNIILFDERTITDIQVLDTKGYYRESVSPSSASGGQRIDLLQDAVYYVVNFEAPADYTPVIYTKATQNAHIRKPFEEQLRAFDADGSLSWSATGLPNGLTISPSGLVSGTPTESGLFTPEVTVADADGSSTTATVKLAVIGELTPIELWNDRPDFDGAKQTGFGWIAGLEHYPFVYSYAFGSWLYVLAQSSTLNNMNFYIYDLNTWAWTSEVYNGWWYDYATANWTDVTPAP